MLLMSPGGLVVVLVQEVSPDWHHMAQSLENNIAVVVVEADNAGQVHGATKGSDLPSTCLEFVDKVQSVK
jgi:hypothetical protein